MDISDVKKQIENISLDEIKYFKSLLKAKKREILLQQCQYKINEVIKEPCTKNRIDEFLFDSLNENTNKKLIETAVGSYWNIVFDKQNIISELRGFQKIYKRISSYDLDCSSLDCNDNEHCLFYRLNKKGKIETIILTNIYPNIRKDNVIVSGLQSRNHVKCEDNQTIISWKFK